MDKMQLKETMQKAEAKRQHLVDLINNKRADAKTLSFEGDSPQAKGFVDDYNNLIEEHNSIVDIQKSLADNAKEYQSLSGDKGFQEYFNFDFKRLGRAVLTGGSSKTSEVEGGQYLNLFEKLKERREVKKEAKAEAKDQGLSNKDARKAGKEAVKDAGLQSKVGQKIKTVALAAPRGAYISLLALNLWSMASGLKIWKDQKNKSYDTVRNAWYRLGGNRTEFDKAVDNGSQRKAKNFIYKKGTFGAKKFTGQEDLNALGVDDAAIAGYITAAGGVLSSLVKAFKSSGGKTTEPSGSEQLPEPTPDERDTMTDIGQAVDSGAVDPEDNTTTYLIVGAGLLALVGIGIGLYFALRKKKKS